jgi:phospho-N-acetylmuramoyl-pentapeptide-transferase
VLHALFQSLQRAVPEFNLFRYITVRTALAGVTALILTMVLAPVFIRGLRRFQIGQSIRPEGPASHISKQGTPTMGGLLIITSTIIPTLLWGDLTNTYILLTMATMIAFGAIGFLDDYIKVRKKQSLGLIARSKILFQIILAAVFALLVLFLSANGDFDLHLFFPVLKHWAPYLGWIYAPWIIFILVSSTNAVNLADGLDGLAIGLTLISAAALSALTYIAGHAVFSKYLYIARVPLAAELTVFGGALVGACLGFLWYNSHPAQVYMGDVGALSLGATLAAMAILIKQEFLIFAVGGVFILEALSVLLQVSYFKATGGKRIFKMAPLHHHFELLGWPEEKVVVRFWILGIIFALFSLTTLKLR